VLRDRLAMLPQLHEIACVSSPSGEPPNGPGLQCSDTTKGALTPKEL
jgi:hypothetical protein